MDINFFATYLGRSITPFAALMLVGTFMALRRHDTKRRHRSVAQWIIYVLRRFSLFLWAVQAGFDTGYLKYRQMLGTKLEPLENEEHLGLLLGSTKQQEA